MILTSLAQLKHYISIPFLAEINSFLCSHDTGAMVEGDYEIRGKDLYYRVLRYMPRVVPELKLETHHIYTDVHVLLEGKEIIPVALFEDLMPISEYDPINDIQFFDAKKHLAEIVFQPKMLAVFFPGESHASKQHPNYATSVKKLVFKVRI